MPNLDPAVLGVTDTITRWLTTAVNTSGTWPIGAAMLAENLFPPIPSEAVLPLAGFLIGQGVLEFVPTLLVATAGSVVGALILYAIGRWGGRPVLLRWGRILRVTESDLDRADDWFDTHGWHIVLWGRMIPLVRSVVSIPAGASEMPIGRFTALTTAGSAAWNAILIGAGIALGDRWEQVTELVGTYSKIAVAVLGVAFIAAVVWLLRRRRAS